jgi:uncharacterized membrane protein
MQLDFQESIDVPASVAYPFFRTPADWTRLYGSFGAVRQGRDGWWRVPLRRFPFPLVARITRDEPERLVHWELKGFFQGEGEVRFEPRPGGVVISGFERVSTPWLGPLSRVVERRILERRFRGIWSAGWRRLRKQAEAGSHAERAVPLAS